MFFIPKSLKETLLGLLTVDESNIVNLITLQGEHASGKDIYACILKSLTPKDTTTEIVRFADPLRQAICKALNFTEQDLDRLKRFPFLIDQNIEGWKVKGHTLRETLVTVAEGNKQRYGEFYYANLAIQKINEHIDFLNLRFKQTCKNEGCKPLKLNIVIPDLRFPCEQETLQEFSATKGVQLKQIIIGKDLPQLEMVDGSTI